MRGVAVLCCAAALAEVAQAQERLEFSGLESPCDEAAGTQADDMAAMEATNDDITDQIADLQTRVDNELITYGDTTNTCLSTYCAVGGGQNNQVDEDSDFSFIRGGKANWCYESSPYSTILGGQSNIATGDYCSLGGGIKNKCYSNYAAIGGGYMNMANARFSMVPGGSKNTAKGRYSLASGFAAVADADYAATFNLLDDSTGCVNEVDNSVMVCAEMFILNGVDVISSFDSRRMLKEDGTDCAKEDESEAAEKRLDTLETIVSLLSVLSN